MEKKEIIRRPLKRTNQPFELPMNPTWLKQPNPITMLAGNFNFFHVKLVIAIVESLQEQINQNIQYPSLFPADNKHVSIKIPLQSIDLGGNKKHYNKFKNAVNDLATISINLKSKYPTGEEYTLVGSLFSAEIPKYSRDILIDMRKEVADVFVNTYKVGYTSYLKEITNKFTSKYTLRLYMFISSWKNKGGCEIRYKDFKVWLGLEKKYPKFLDFYKRVIRPAYEDLHENADVWFEMKEYYAEGASEPEKLAFKIIQPQLLVQQNLGFEKGKETIVQVLTDMNVHDSTKALVITKLTIDNYSKVINSLMELKFNHNLEQVKDINAFVRSKVKDILEE